MHICCRLHTCWHPNTTCVCSAAIGQLLSDILRRNSEQGSSSSGRDGSSSSSSGSDGDGSNTRAAQGVKVVNNLDWFGPMSFLTFLREVGKFARVGTMLSKDSVGDDGVAGVSDGDGGSVAVA